MMARCRRAKRPGILCRKKYTNNDINWRELAKGKIASKIGVIEKSSLKVDRKNNERLVRN